MTAPKAGASGTRRPAVVDLGWGGPLCVSLAASLGFESLHVTRRSFPDGETYLRVDDDCRDRLVVVVCSLDHADSRILPLILAAETLRDLGASGVGLVAPYLGYMRQDRRFHPGESVSSAIFAGLLSRSVDWLVTIDPHLHRYASLAEVYRIPSRAARSAPAIAAWLAQQPGDLLLVGPDAESHQWVADVAERTGLPFVVARKVRHGDREVDVILPDLSPHLHRQPLLLDDIISSGGTMAQAALALTKAGMQPAHCIGVHPVFAEGAERRLTQAGVVRVTTCNTIEHPTNGIDVSAILETAVLEMI